MARRVWRVITRLAVFIVSFFVFYQVVQTHSGGLGKMWSSQSPDIFLVLAPCVVFGTTTIAYYHFIADYTWEMAGPTFFGFLVALWCCQQLTESKPEHWSDHLFWMYVLFYSYVVWDVFALEYCLPAATPKTAVAAASPGGATQQGALTTAQNPAVVPALPSEDEQDTKVLTTYINRPTLGTILIVALVARHFDSASVGIYVDGVVSFHLVFASVACLFTMRSWWK